MNIDNMSPKLMSNLHAKALSEIDLMEKAAKSYRTVHNADKLDVFTFEELAHMTAKFSDYVLILTKGARVTLKELHSALTKMEQTK